MFNLSIFIAMLRLHFALGAFFGVLLAAIGCGFASHALFRLVEAAL